MKNILIILFSLFTIISYSQTGESVYRIERGDTAGIILKNAIGSTASIYIDPNGAAHIINDTLYIECLLIPSEVIHLFYYFGDSTVTYSFAVSDTWYQLTNASDSLWIKAENDGFTNIGDTIIPNISGDYDFEAKLNYIASNGVTQNIRFYNVTQAVGIPAGGANTGRGSGNELAIIVSAYGEDINAGDKIILQIRQDATPDITLRSSSIKARLLHN